jgi:DNA repair protein SbcD/Mre11
MAATIILGDVHLAKGLSLGKSGVGSALNSRIVDQMNILEWTLERAIEEMASTLIITGDIFEDAKPHPMVITIFVSWLKKCADNGLTVHIIAGNHETLRSGQFYMSALDVISAAEIDNVFFHKNITTIHMNGVSYTLMPFRDRRSFNTDSNAEAIKLLSSKLPYEVSEIDQSSAKVVVGHLAIEGSLPVGDEIGDMGNELFCPFDMFARYDYVWMGHIHKPQVMKKNPYISHIGSMDISDFGETDHKKVIAIFDPDKSATFRYLEIPTRPLRQISITVPASIDNTTNYVLKELDKEKDLSKAIVRLNITLENQQALNVDRGMIEKSLMSKDTFHIARINEEKNIALLKNSATDIIDNSVNEMTAIKTYAAVNVEADIRDKFITLATNIVKEYTEA